MDKEVLKKDHSKYWKYYVDLFLETLNEDEKRNTRGAFTNLKNLLYSFRESLQLLEGE